MTYGPYGKWLHFEDLYTEQWRRMCEDHPDVPTGSTNKYQCWEVVDPEKWVPDGYVVHSRRQPRRRPLARRDRHLVAARGDGPRACVEWAGVQPWSNGKVGIERHLLLRREPVAMRGAAAQAPRRHLPVGGRRRLLSRHGASRRHLLQRLHARLVALAGLHAAARARHARLQEPHERRLGVGPDRAHRGGARRQPAQFLRGLPRPQARHRRLLAVAHARLVEGQGAAVLGRQLGRPGPASARQFRRLRARGLRRRNGSNATASSTGRISTPTTASACRRSSSAISSRARTPAGRSSPGCSCRSATSAKVRRAARERMAARAHAMDQVLPRSREPCAVDRAAEQGVVGDLWRASPTA